MSSPYIFFGYGTAFWEDGKWLISCLVKGERSQIPVIFPVQEKYKPKTKMKTRCPRSHSIFKKEMPNLPRKTIIHTRSFHCFPLFKALRKGWFFFFFLGNWYLGVRSMFVPGPSAPWSNMERGCRHSWVVGHQLDFLGHDYLRSLWNVRWRPTVSIGLFGNDVKVIGTI